MKNLSLIESQDTDILSEMEMLQVYGGMSTGDMTPEDANLNCPCPLYEFCPC